MKNMKIRLKNEKKIYEDIKKSKVVKKLTVKPIVTYHYVYYNVIVPLKYMEIYATLISIFILLLFFIVQHLFYFIILLVSIEFNILHLSGSIKHSNYSMLT